MAITPSQLLQSATDIGLVSAEAVSAFLAGRGIDPEQTTLKELARAIVDAGLLTKFQVEVIAAGKTKGLVIGDYVVTEKIGQGGMGQVFKAQHKRMKRTVAIKMLPRARVDSEAMVRRFYREVEAAAKLNHPNIVTAYDAGEHHGTHFLVMEFVDGMDLAALLKERGKLGLEQAVNVTLQTAAGLLYAHKQGVVHRDIKPGNLLVDREGAVRILDMGLARMDGDAAAPGGEQSLTMAGRLMGTVEYMAPEQAANARTADLRADIYALGCTFYRLVTGNLPYKGENPMETVIAHREQPIPSLGDKSVIPKALQLIFAGMVAKKAADRYGSMQAVIDDLLAVMPEATRCPVRLGPEEQSTFTINQPGSSTMQKLGAASSASRAIPVAIPVAQPARKPAAKQPAWWKSPAVLGGAGAAALVVIVVTIALVKRSGGETVPKVVASTAQKAPAPAAPKPAAAPVSGPRDPAVRRALEWVLSVGGKVRQWKGDASYGPELDSIDRVTDAVLDRLAVHISSQSITDNDLARLAPLKTLRSLNMMRSSIGDAAMRHIGTLRSIERLSVAATRITDAGIDDLARLDNLTYLQLDDTRITGRALAVVAKLPLLKILDLNRTAVSRADVQQFNRDAPQCRVQGRLMADTPAPPPTPSLADAAPTTPAPQHAAGVDILASLSPDKPQMGAKWFRRGAAIEYSSGQQSIFAVPGELRGNYDVLVRFARSGIMADLALTLPILDHHTLLILKGDALEQSRRVVGLQDFDGKNVTVPSEAVRPLPKFIKPGQVYTLEVAVRFAGAVVDIDARLDGAPLLQWQGDARRLSPNQFWGAALGRHQLGIGGSAPQGNRLTITEARAWGLEAAPVPTVASLPTGAAPAVTEPAAPPVIEPAAPAAVDLLPTFDFKADALRGTWTRKEDALHNDGRTVAAQLLAPFKVRGDYDLELEFTRTGGPDGLAFVLPIGDAATALLVGASGNKRLALADVKGVTATRSSDSNKPFTLENGRRYKLLVRTRLTGDNAHVEVLVDDSQVIDWTGPCADLTVNKTWAQPAAAGPPRLSLGSNRSDITFHTARLRPAGGEVTTLRTN